MLVHGDSRVITPLAFLNPLDSELLEYVEEYEITKRVAEPVLIFLLFGKDDVMLRDWLEMAGYIEIFHYGVHGKIVYTVN